MLKPISNLAILQNNRVPDDFYASWPMSSRRKKIAQFMQDSIEQFENLEDDLELINELD